MNPRKPAWEKWRGMDMKEGKGRAAVWLQTRGVRLQPPHVDAGMLCVREARDYLRGGSVCLFHVSCVITDGRRTRNGSTKHSFPRGGRPTESLVGMKHERVAAMRGRQCEHRLTLETWKEKRSGIDPQSSWHERVCGRNVWAAVWAQLTLKAWKERRSARAQ